MDKEFAWFLRQFDEATAKFAVKLLGIRGWFHENQGGGNDLGVYDDLIVSFIGDNGTKFAASVDPGWYWIENPDQEGQKYCAQLVEGVHKFKLGPHGPEKHLAFVQAEKFYIHRLDKQGRIVLTEFGEFGIHLHSGGPGPDVGTYSAGCQIIECPEGYFGQTWLDFFTPVKDAMNDSNQKVVPYTLVDRDEMVP
jgi:hypothetical protein